MIKFKYYDSKNIDALSELEELVFNVKHNKFELAPCVATPFDYYLKGLTHEEYWEWIKNSDVIKEAVNNGCVLPNDFSIIIGAFKNNKLIGWTSYIAEGVPFKSSNIEEYIVSFNNGCFIGGERMFDYTYVVSDYRRRGVGVSLIDKLISKAVNIKLPVKLFVINNFFKRSIINSINGFTNFYEELLFEPFIKF